MDRPKIDFRFEHFDVIRSSDLIDIYEKCFGKKPNERYFQWKLKENPAGPAEAFIALDGDTIAGFYGVIPEDYIVRGEKRVIYQSMDTMTHPDYRRMGLFTNLAKATYKYLADQYRDVYIIGFPGLTSHPGFIKKLGWKDALILRFHFVYRSVFKLRNMLKGKPELLVTPIDSFGPEHTAYLDGPSNSDKPIRKFIDSRFLNWRFIEAPLGRFRCIAFTLNGRNAGIAVYKVEDNGRCFIQFIDVANAAMFRDAVGSLTRFLFKNTDAGAVYAFEATLPTLKKAYASNGYINNPAPRGPFSYRPPVILYSNRQQIGGIDFFNIDNWDVQAVLRDY